MANPPREQMKKAECRMQKQSAARSTAKSFFNSAFCHSSFCLRPDRPARARRPPAAARRTADAHGRSRQRLPHRRIARRRDFSLRPAGPPRPGAFCRRRAAGETAGREKLFRADRDPTAAHSRHRRQRHGFAVCRAAWKCSASSPVSSPRCCWPSRRCRFITAAISSMKPCSSPRRSDLIVSGGRALKTNRHCAAALAGFCAALMLACKETAVHPFFCALGAGCRPPGEPPNRSAGLRSGSLEAARIAAVPGAPCEKSFTASAVFIFTAILLFTWFGRNWSALADLLQAVPHFAARAGGEGHEKPFGYYFGCWTAMLVLALVAAGRHLRARFAMRSGRVRTAGILLGDLRGWSSFLIYSAIPYKTPWLALNLWLPLACLPAGRRRLLGKCRKSGGALGHDRCRRPCCWSAR